MALPPIWFLGLLVATAALVLAVGWAAIAVRRFVSDRGARRRLERALAALDASLEEILVRGPYRIEARSGQGEAPEFRVIDERRPAGHDVAATFATHRSACLWIAERLVAERAS